MHGKSLFPDEEPGKIYQRISSQPAPLTRRGKIYLWTASLGIATLVHGIIKDNIYETNQMRARNMRNLAEENGKAVIVQEKTSTIRTQITEVLTGQELVTETQTTIINPPGQEPPITVITPKKTIIADQNGEVKEIIPHNTNNTVVMLQEAQPIVNEALKDAEKKTLSEDITLPMRPTED